MVNNLTEDEKYIAWSIEQAIKPGAVLHKVDFNKLHKGWEERQKEKLNKDRK